MGALIVRSFLIRFRFVVWNSRYPFLFPAFSLLQRLRVWDELAGIRRAIAVVLLSGYA